MNNLQQIQLAHGVVRAGHRTMEKAASADTSPQQRQILQEAWPQQQSGMTKLATLAQMLATGLMLDEAAASVSGA